MDGKAYTKAVDVLVGVRFSGAGVGLFDADGGGAVDDAYMAPFPRLTRLGGAIFPAKNSPAVRAGSAESAGG
jgi:hypothetical protein